MLHPQPEDKNIIPLSFEPENRNSSFESILLKKINKTPSSIQKRRKIINGSQLFIVARNM